MTRAGAVRDPINRIVLGVACAAATCALSALAPAGAAAGFTTRVFTASYDGGGSFNYSAQGSSTDTGCYMNLGAGDRYGFDQLWRVKIGFKRLAKGRYASKVDSITHVDGPQALGRTGAVHLKGQQVAKGGDCFNESTGGHDTGTFDCTSGSPTLTAFPNPQIDITAQGGDLIAIARAFLDAHLKYTGTDTIPSDARFFGGCAHYNDDWTFGSTLSPGTYATARVSLPVKELAGLAKGSSLTEHVGLDHNTELPAEESCSSTFGPPRVCTVNSVTLSGTFRWGRSR